MTITNTQELDSEGNVVSESSTISADLDGIQHNKDDGFSTEVYFKALDEDGGFTINVNISEGDKTYTSSWNLGATFGGEVKGVDAEGSLGYSRTSGQKIEGASAGFAWNMRLKKDKNGILTLYSDEDSENPNGIDKLNEIDPQDDYGWSGEYGWLSPRIRSTELQNPITVTGK